MNELLVNSGAGIAEINAVRKHLSLVKGGQLAAAAWPARVMVLTLSDVPGDLPEVIASGPLSPDPSTFADAIAIIEKYELAEKMPDTLLRYLREGSEGIHPETPKPGDVIFSEVSYNIIGSGAIALKSSEKRAIKLGFNVTNYGTSLFGDVEEAATRIASQALKIREKSFLPDPVCLLFGGETTLKVKGSGTGGRNQHLALLCADLLKDTKGITVLCGGSDGTDGPTGAAGAIVDSNTWRNALSCNIFPESYLEKFDSFNFFREAGGHLITGPTNTNVMDIAVVLIR
jgi:hydroxypyruvate reductase/glycerate 2-kinase